MRFVHSNINKLYYVRITVPCLVVLGGFHLLEHRGGWQNLKVDL